MQSKKCESSAAGLLIVADVFGKTGTLLAFDICDLVCIIDREYPMRVLLIPSQLASFCNLLRDVSPCGKWCAITGARCFHTDGHDDVVSWGINDAWRYRALRSAGISLLLVNRITQLNRAGNHLNTELDDWDSCWLVSDVWPNKEHHNNLRTLLAEWFQLV